MGLMSCRRAVGWCFESSVERREGRTGAGGLASERRHRLKGPFGLAQAGRESQVQRDSSECDAVQCCAS